MFSLLCYSQQFQVKISQHGDTLSVAENVIELERAPFDIIVMMPPKTHLLVSASYNDRTFNMAQSGAAMNSMPGFSETAMAEGLFNADRELMVFYYAPSYWYYEDDYDNRFNRTKQKNNQVQCVRTIEYINSLTHDKRLPVAAQNKPLYLTFISYNRLPGPDNKKEEVQRHTLKLDWK